MRCQYCGTELQPGERFCYRCGKAVEQAPQKRYCACCGAELEADAAFCWKCGSTADGEPQKRYCACCGAELEADAAFCWKCGSTADGMRRPAEQPADLRQEEAPDKARPFAAEPAAAPIAEEPAEKQSEPDEQDDRKARTEALVIAAQNGDGDSFTELYRLYYQKVFALAKTTVKSDADAEDVLQMTFLKAWDNLAKLKNTAAFSTWIQRITLNQCYSLLRKKHVDVSIDNDDEDAEPIQIESDLMLPEAYAERSDLKARLGKIIRELSAVQQQTITLYYFDELPVENIAWIMDCSVNTVKSRLFLARKSIKTEIEEQERKTGQPFYGIVGLGLVPFGKLFLAETESSALSQTAASAVLETITQRIAGVAAKTAGQAAVKAAGAAAKGAAKAGAGTAAKAGAGTVAKAATAAVSKKIIAGIVAGVLATGAVTGGTVAAVSAVQKHKAQTAQAETVATAKPDAWDAFADPDQAGTPPQAGTANTLSDTERMAYRAYLDCLIENKAGIDNYIWQKGYTLMYDENENDVPLTDENLSRPVALCDVYGDELPELIYVGDVAPGEWVAADWGGYYQNDSDAYLHIVTCRDGKLVTLYNDVWDGWGDSWNGYHFFQTDGSKTLYATESNGDLSFWDYVYCFPEGADGMLHKEQVCLVYEDEDDGMLYYGKKDQRISESECRSILQSLSENTTEVLMYSRIGIPEFRAAVNRCGCSAMTCDEAIAYFEKQLDINRATALNDRPADSSYFTTTFTSSSGKIGTASVRLKKGFGFLNTDSSQPNPELALTAITLSAQVYKSAQGKKTEEILYALGYDMTSFSNGDSSFAHPGVCFGYKQIEKGKNLFVAVVRGTDTTNDLTDVWTDLQDGALAMFEVSGKYIEIQLEDFMEKATGKTKAALQKEDNYFFFAGHSLGGAVANYLSINKDVMDFAGSDKGKIYTYTFESPHTCVNLWWTNPASESNAFNYKVDGDAVTNLPPYIGSTTYGKDVWIKVSELNDDLFRKLFPDSESKTLADATSVSGHGDSFGLHDVCLDLVYIADDLEITVWPEGMYRAYLDVLQKHEKHILRYQKDAWFDANTRPIALRNVYGDETPELLFLESVSGDYEDVVNLVIVTCSNGSAQTIFSDTVCYDIIEESFFLYQLPGNDTLYLSTSSGRQDVSMDLYCAFLPTANGNLKLQEKMYLEEETDPDSGSKRVYFCQIDGKSAKESEFKKEETYIFNHSDCVLQGNLIPKYGYRAESIASMTYEEAIQQFKQLIANSILG